jgi:hypothetical protein
MKSKAFLSGPAGNCRQVSGDVISTKNQLYYRSLNDEELLQALRQSVSTLQSTSVHTNRELRQHLCYDWLDNLAETDCL